MQPKGASSVSATETRILNMVRETGGDPCEDDRSINQQFTIEKATEYFINRILPFGERYKHMQKIIGGLVRGLTFNDIMLGVFALRN